MAVGISGAGGAWFGSISKKGAHSLKCLAQTSYLNLLFLSSQWITTHFLGVSSSQCFFTLFYSCHSAASASYSGALWQFCNSCWAKQREIQSNCVSKLVVSVHASTYSKPQISPLGINSVNHSLRLSCLGFVPPRESCLTPVSPETCPLVQAFLAECPGRLFLGHAQTQLKTGLQIQERHLFLFTDTLLVTKAK